jgi:hypothetical protein
LAVRHGHHSNVVQMVLKKKEVGEDVKTETPLKTAIVV